MKKVGLHIKDGKITTDDGKEMVLVYIEWLEHLQKQLDDATTTIISLYNMGIKNNIPEVMSLVLDYVRKYGTTEEPSVNNI